MIAMPTDAEPVTVVEGDCLEMLRGLPDGCVDAVVTDPPYPMDYWDTVSAALAECARVLRDRGELIALTGHHMLPRAIRWLEDAGLRYWWTCGMLHKTHQRMLGKNVTICWKPAVWFVKGKKRNLSGGVPMDMLGCHNPEKGEHPWEQGVPWFRHWCQRASEPGELILDPFAGTGTTGVAAIAEGRRAILIEKEPKYADICRRRVTEALGLGKGSLLATLPAASLFGDVE